MTEWTGPDDGHSHGVLIQPQSLRLSYFFSPPKTGFQFSSTLLYSGLPPWFGREENRVTRCFIIEGAKTQSELRKRNGRKSGMFRQYQVGVEKFDTKHHFRLGRSSWLAPDCCYWQGSRKCFFLYLLMGKWEDGHPVDDFDWPLLSIKNEFISFSRYFPTWGIFF